VTLRGLHWTRATSQEVADEAAARLPDVDEDRVLMNHAVKSVDGFFTTFFVSPYSRYLARWAGRRGLTPNQVTTASIVLGGLSAACFATGERWGLVAGAVLLQIAFTTDCVDGQLARYTRQFSELGAWLDATFDRAKEYLVFAGLAIGADRAGDPVWVLAGAALTLQTLRHTMDFSFHAAMQHQRAEVVRQPPVEQSLDAAAAAAAARGGKPKAAGPKPPLARWGALDTIPGVAWVKRAIAFPIGERFALISLTAAIWSARTTFIAVLAWGGFAATYGFAGRLLRARGLKSAATPELELYRDDGLIARVLAPLGRRLPAPALVVVGVVPLVAAMAIKGDGASNATAVAVIAWLAVAGGLSGGRAGNGRLRWIVPPLLRFGEYAGLLWLGTLAGASSIPAAFALLAALALRHYDIVYGLRYRGAPVSEWLGMAAGGWDGRLVLGCVLLITGALPAGFYVLAAIIAVVFSAAAIRDWSQARRPVTFHDDKEDEDA
jgi:phosphatidylglycerophosphate synthase